MIKRLLLTAVIVGTVTATDTTFAAQDIKIGVTEALSDGAAQYSVAIRNGFQLAVDKINATGGINGSKIALVIEDEQGKRGEAINVFKKLIFQDRVAMVFGPTLSNPTQAADPIAQTSKTVTFGTSNTADGITSIDGFVFRSFVTEADVLPAAIQAVAKKAGVKKVTVLYGSDGVSTKSGYDNFKKALEDLKIPATTAETFVKGDIDFKTQFTKIKATNPGAIVLSALAAEGGPTMMQTHRLGLNILVIGGSDMNSIKMFDLAKDKPDSLWVGSLWSIGSHTPENSKFIIAYTAKYKAAPDRLATQAHDAMYITGKVLKVVKFSNNLEADRKTIHDALSAVKHTGATDAFAFRQVTAHDKPAGHDAVQMLIMNVTKNGKYTIEK